MVFVYNLKYLVARSMVFGKHSLHQNEFEQLCCPKGEGQDAHSNFIPFMQYPG